MKEDFRITMLEREAGAPANIDALLIEMWMDTVESPRKSKMAGYAVFEEVPWIRILVPGEQNKSIAERPATERDKQRFPLTYQKLMSVDRTSQDGLPIEHWGPVTRSLAMTFKAASVPTVEVLASLPDAHIDKFGTVGRELRAKAQAFLAVSKDAAAAQEFKAKADRSDAIISELQRQVQELAARLDAPAEEKRGPGRPRKIQEGDMA